MVTSQTEDDSVVLFQLQGHVLKDVHLKIPVTHPTATMASYYVVEKPLHDRNTTKVKKYDQNDMFLFILSHSGLSVLQTVQFGNGINLQTASP